MFIKQKSLGEKENQKHEFFSESDENVGFDDFWNQVIFWIWEWLKKRNIFAKQEKLDECMFDACIGLSAECIALVIYEVSEMLSQNEKKKHRRRKHQWPLPPLSNTYTFLNIYPSWLSQMILTAKSSRQACIRDNIKKHSYSLPKLPHCHAEPN